MRREFLAPRTSNYVHGASGIPESRSSRHAHGTYADPPVSRLFEERVMRKPSAIVVLLLFVTHLSIPAPLRACSIAISIWNYAEDAEAIVLARVERVDVHDLGMPPARAAGWRTEPRTRRIR